MVLIINPHHMGFNRLKTKRGQWCTQRELIDLFLHNDVGARKIIETSFSILVVVDGKLDVVHL